MKKNAVKKLLSVSLVSAMAVSMLAGCGESNTTATTTTTPETTTSTTEAAPEVTIDPEVVVGIEGFTPFENKVTLEIPVYDRGASGNGCSNVQDNYWTKWVQSEFGDKYNIDVKYIGITRSAVMNDYAMLAADKKLPTICMEYDYDKLATWVADGYLQPYSLEQLATIAPTYYQTMVDSGNVNYTKMEGDDYIALGFRPYGFSTYTFCTWYRADWAEEAGYSEYPKTTTEYLDMMEKITANGHKYPLGGSKVSGAGIDQNHGFRDYPQDEVIWATTGDYQIPALSTEAQKRMLKLENYKYNHGLTDPEYYLKDSSENDAKFINGETFTWSGYVSSTMNVLNSLYEKDPNAKLAIVPQYEYTEDATWGSNNSFRAGSNIGMMTGFAFDATEDEVKAAMMYMEWLSQPENLTTMQWGLEGVNYNVENGAKVAVGDQSGLAEQQGHNNNVDYWCIITAIKTVGTIEEDVAAIAPQGLPQDFTQQILDRYNGQKAVFDAGKANSDCMFACAIDAVAEYNQTLYDLYTESRDKLTMCPEDQFDALYDELSAKYLEAGYQAVIDDRKAAFDAGKTSRLPL